MESPLKIASLGLNKNLGLNLLNLPSFSFRFLRLSLINILSNLMVPLSGLLSVTFLGHLGEIHHLAGVTLATILFNYLYRSLGFLRTSTTGITAHGVGAKNDEEVLLVLLRNGLLALILGLIILALQYPLGWLGFTLISAAPAVKASAHAYYDLRILGAPAVLLNFVIIGWFLGKEQSSKVLLLSLIGNGANVILDYLLIIRWGWESGGAGLATSISQIIMCIFGLILVALEVNWTELKQVSKLLNFEKAQDNLMLNRDLFIRTLVLLSAFSLFTSVSSAMGTLVLAENAVLLQVFSLAVYLVDGLAFATESLAGNFKGQGTHHQLIPLLKLAGIISFFVGLGAASVFVLFPETLFGLLTNHQEILPDLSAYVVWLLPVLGFGSIAFILDGYFIGLAEGVMLRNTALGSTFFGFVPMAMIAWRCHDSNLLWLALSSFMATRAILLGLKVPKTLKS
ncbi:guanitoxin biosynthesis MATE family efflux transporter GntT [Crocosphaera sp. XPORK-15E]|uniref:guanitoxin biosynthesis MATE family efflux transporter GntT n=1 Tax=Crocosphaera sp. XPORK-15E TaxID=3110247 RepID=UPI002B1FB400|nr:guanitoxin biosynthesis MATE family efflux transporter GntT [Crocosphaera sp. XPORK-15E]MEA5534865.1 guanitoxin biosynthesis MATE family efflux transporter GntT [Crocosphaera sp. XPORK-15E]